MGLDLLSYITEDAGQKILKIKNYHVVVDT